MGILLCANKNTLAAWSINQVEAYDLISTLNDRGPFYKRFIKSLSN